MKKKGIIGLLLVLALTGCGKDKASIPDGSSYGSETAKMVDVTARTLNPLKSKEDAAVIAVVKGLDTSALSGTSYDVLNASNCFPECYVWTYADGESGMKYDDATGIYCQFNNDSESNGSKVYHEIWYGGDKEYTLVREYPTDAGLATFKKYADGFNDGTMTLYAYAKDYMEADGVDIADLTVSSNKTEAKKDEQKEDDKKKEDTKAEKLSDTDKKESEEEFDVDNLPVENPDGVDLPKNEEFDKYLDEHPDIMASFNDAKFYYSVSNIVDDHIDSCYYTMADAANAKSVTDDFTSDINEFSYQGVVSIGDGKYDVYKVLKDSDQSGDFDVWYINQSTGFVEFMEEYKPGNGADYTVVTKLDKDHPVIEKVDSVTLPDWTKTAKAMS